jgi:Asp-tRNA(Asn)/Glu-tRNA(Gln) amidotransferase A subunit family amidase
MSELHYLSASEALARFRARELSPVELLDALIARAEAVEPTVNALCHTFYDVARAQAREAERRYAGRGEAPRALEGIPLAVKEEEAIAGQPWTQGSLIYRDLVAETTSVFAQRMLDAGAIVHARTTAPEFSCAYYTHSRIWGVTRNPWNPEVGAGGSSGGSGAALAAGTTTLASGSDIGGSIRVPASFNGVVGFKPAYGRVPQDPPFNLDTYCHCGPMARTVADCALFENVVAGPDPSDVVSLRPKLVLPDHFDGIAGMRIALSVDLGDWHVDPEVRTNTLAVGDALCAAGATVDVVDVHVPRERVLRACAIHFDAIFGPWIASEVAAHADLVTSYAAAFGPEMAALADGATVLDGLELEGELYAPVGALLEEYAALVCPTTGTRGLVAGEDYLDGATEDSMLTLPFNVMSRCPVLAVPSGVADNGVPTGVQIVGRTYDDETVFRIGAALERERPWADRRPGLLQGP